MMNIRPSEKSIMNLPNIVLAACLLLSSWSILHGVNPPEDRLLDFQLMMCPKKKAATLTPQEQLDQLLLCTVFYYRHNKFAQFITDVAFIPPCTSTQELLAVFDVGGIEKVIETLKHHGANINATTKHEQRSILHVACSSTSLELMRILLRQKASIEQKTTGNCSVLHYALAHYPYSGIPELLIEHANAPKASPTEHKIEIDPNMILDGAVKGGNLRFIRLALSLGANHTKNSAEIHTTGTSDVSPFFQACYYYIKPHSPSIVTELLSWRSHVLSQAYKEEIIETISNPTLEAKECALVTTSKKVEKRAQRFEQQCAKNKIMQSISLMLQYPTTLPFHGKNPVHSLRAMQLTGLRQSRRLQP